MPFFDRGFRPFFFSAAAFAGLAVPVWLLVLAGRAAPLSHLQTLDWHVHEMIFGYVPAVLAGFALTAMPNWTGRPPLAGARLAALWALWLAGRVAIAVSEAAPLAAALVDCSFLIAVAAYAWREVRAGGNVRNYPVCALIAALALANIGFHSAALADLGVLAPTRIALSLIAILIALIGGRVVPNFTANWLAGQGIERRPAPFDRFDKLATAAIVPALGAWIADLDDRVTGVLFAVAAVALAARLARWSGWMTLREPLVAILHVGFAWLAVWCALMVGALLDVIPIDRSAALHALTSGAVGTMTVAIMSRASLGHSGRPLTAGPLTCIVYGLVVAGAALRTLSDALPLDYIQAMSLSGLLWAAGMALFAAGYAPIFFGPRQSAALQTAAKKP
jgi:uncharacterized protein involved in response to NO